MTTDSASAAGDPRRLLSDVRALAQRVRLDQRVTWVALLVLAAVTLVAVPIDWYFLHADCADTIAGGDGCVIRRLNVAFYWLPALLVAYTAIAVYAARVTRARGLGARVLPYVLTGVALTFLTFSGWLAATLYWSSHQPPTEPLPDWVMALDRLIAPVGTIGVALLVLAWLERHVALLVFTLGYLALVLVPVDAYRIPQFMGFATELLLPQLVSGVVLLLGAVGFAAAHRRQR